MRAPNYIWIIGLALASFLTLESAYGQFQSVGPGTTYTEQDIAQGKADHLTRYQDIAIISASMEPTLIIGQTVTIDYQYNWSELEVGDIITFIPDAEAIQEAYDNGHLAVPFTSDGIMHRITDIDRDDGIIVSVETQGDNNDNQIEGVETEILESQYVGKVVQDKSVDLQL